MVLCRAEAANLSAAAPGSAKQHQEVEIGAIGKLLREVSLLPHLQMFLCCHQQLLLRSLKSRRSKDLKDGTTLLSDLFPLSAQKQKNSQFVKLSCF